jgi:hypothetical protein
MAVRSAWECCSTLATTITPFVEGGMERETPFSPLTGGHPEGAAFTSTNRHVHSSTTKQVSGE